MYMARRIFIKQSLYSWLFPAFIHRVCWVQSCKMVLTFETVDEILWYDYPHQTSLAVLSHRTICFLEFYKIWNFVTDNYDKSQSKWILLITDGDEYSDMIISSENT